MDNLQELKTKLEEKLNKQYPARIFLDRLRVIDEDSRKTSAYTDPRFIPFYYWLGSMTQPESLVEIGFRLGLFSSCFLKDCKTVKKFVGFQQKANEFYSPNLGRRNVKDNYKGDMWLYVGDIHDDAMNQLLCMSKWDMIIINEELGYDAHKSILDICWSHMNLNGLIAMDYVNSNKAIEEAYHDFCKGNNRVPTIVDTRYGVGLLRK